MSYTAFCIVDGPEMSAAVVSSLGRAGFTEAEISITPPAVGRISATRQARTSPVPATGFRQPLGSCSVVGATLGIIASLSAIAMPDTRGDDGSRFQQAMQKEPSSGHSRHTNGFSAEARERVQAIGYHLSPGKSLIAVQTSNCYEIETILEIFRERGAIHCAHIVEDGGSDSEQSLPVASTLAHDRTTVLNDRVRESA
jgi:hypothetical protein